MYELTMNNLVPRPLDVSEEVDNVADAIANVHATHLTIIGFVTFALHRLCRAKKVAEPVTQN